MSSAHANGATSLVYRVILVNLGQGSLTDDSGPEAVMFLPLRAKVNLASLALQTGLTVVSEGEYDTAVHWNLNLSSGGAAISSLTVTVQDKPIQDGSPIMMNEEEEEENTLFLYVGGACSGGTAP